MIQLSGVSIRSGAFQIDNIDLSASSGGYIALMGKTGSGKTTILEAIAGLRAVSEGTIRIDDRDVTHVPAALRGIGYVPQDGALFNHMSVFENLAFGLKVRRIGMQERKERVLKLATHFDIQHLLARSPEFLSGGEKQRVALGRALIFSPATLLLDEPLAALDDKTRSHMVQILKEVHKNTSVSILHVTHSTAEAEELADQVYFINDQSQRSAKRNSNELQSPGLVLRR